MEDPKSCLQWPLSQENLGALQESVKEQLNKGNTEPTFSPWKFASVCYKEKIWQMAHANRLTSG